MAPTLRDSAERLGGSARDQVVMVRIDEPTRRKLDAWVETGAVKSRSEAAALFIREGLGVRESELARVGEHPVPGARLRRQGAAARGTGFASRPLDVTMKVAVAILAWCIAVPMGPARSRDSATRQERGTDQPARGSCDGAAPSGCTVFTVSKGNRVFFGGNDDYVNPDSYYWVAPGGAQGYGAIWVGEPDNVQQGVNEKGLAYDANGLPRVDVNPHPERIPVSGGYAAYPIQILRECATVEEVIAWVRTHQWHSYMHDQMHFADATGDAVVISAGADGEVALTRKPRGDGYLVSTNFNVANPVNGFQYPCPRYQTAQDLVGKLVRREGDLTARDAAGVLDAVHMEGATGWTIVSLVADLPHGIVHLHYFHQFDKPVVLNVAEEIARARAAGPLSRLFPEDVRQEAARRYQRYQARKSRCEAAGKAWLGSVLGALVALLIFSRGRRRGWLLWLPVVVVLGPLGLLAWLVAGRGREPGPRRAALVEAVGDVVPTAVAFVTMLAAFVLGLAALGWRAQVLVLLSVPLLMGWLLFHGPLLALGTKRSLPRLLLQRLPQAWVVANLGMAGISAVAAPLATACPLVPLSSWTVATWWAAAALSAPAGAAVLFAYESWAVRRGFRAWSILAAGEGDVVTPAWRRLWWWLPLSYVALIGGIVASVLIPRLLSR